MRDKKKIQRSHIIIYLLLVVMIGVGYAALSVSNKINGVTEIKSASWDIYFDQVEVSDGSVSTDSNTNYHDAIIDSNDSTKVSFSVLLENPGDFYEFKVRAVNDGSIDGMVDSLVSKLNNQVIETLPNYLDYTVTMENGDAISNKHLLAAHSSEKYKVRIEYKKDIEEDDLPDENVSLNFDFSINYVQADSTAVELVSYQVVHRYKNLDNTYTEVIENLKSAKGSSVTPSVSSRNGFISPNTQTITINDDGSSIVTYVYERESYHFSITDRTYIDSSSTSDGDYLFETEIVVKANERSGYSFKWSDNDTNYQRTITLTSDLELTPIYSNNSYTITFHPDEGVMDVDHLSVQQGSNIGEIPSVTKNGYYLDGWYTESSGGVLVNSNTVPDSDMDLYARWKKSIQSATLENSNIEISVGEDEDIVIANSSEIQEEYTFSSSNTSICTVDSNGKVTGVAVGNSSIVITGSSSNQTINVSVTVTEALPSSYTVTLNPNGGTVSENSIDVSVGSSVGTLPTPVRENYIFVGWFTGLSDGIEVDSLYVPNGDVEIIARWNKIICKRATTLHTEECGRTTDGCGAVGYTATGSKGTTTITYGNIPSGNFQVGNAYNCDLNDDGVYSDETERFYYLAPRGDNAVLIFYSNFEGSNGVQITNNFNYATAVTKLPTTTQWNGLNVSFNDTYAARFPYPSEIENACGISITNVNGELDSCVFLLENSRFINTTHGRSGFWLEYANSKYNRVHTVNRRVESVQNSSNNAVKPVIEVAVGFVDNSVSLENSATVSFNTVGGEEVQPIHVIKNHAVGTLPTTTKTNYTFGGWYTDSTYQVEVTSSTIITEDVILVAKWNAIEGAAILNGVGYQTLAAAISAVPNSTLSTITLQEDITETVTIPNGKNIIIDFNNHSLTYDDGNVLINRGILELKNGTINCAASSGAINNESTGNLKLKDFNIYATGTRQGVYNNGGTLEVYDGSTIRATSSERASVHNLNSGTVKIFGGEVISTDQQAVKNESGTLIIGDNDGFVDSSSPILQGKTYGVTGSAFSFYDGVIKGGNTAVEDENVMTYDANSTLIHDVESIDSVNYNKIYLDMLVDKYRIVFNPNGGILENTSKVINVGDPIGELPVPTRSIYTFDGWYTGLTDGVLIDENVVPDGNLTYYARWSYVASNTPVAFNMVNDPMKVYYQNISTWKTDSDNFQTVMKANFDHYNCSCTDNTCTSSGTVYCDKPKSYDTTLGETLKVYLYDVNLEEKKSEVFYTDSSDGIIHNMIPGESYYFELASDPNVHGIVTAEGVRRLIDIDGVRNVRDLGGLHVDSNGDGVSDGVLKYGRLFRGEKLSTNQSAVTSLQNLGVNEEVDLRSSSERGSSEVKFPTNQFKQLEFKHYQIDREHYLSNYNLDRNVIREVMQDVVNDKNIYFHCRIGADRTGTLAYILEGLLQVMDEDRLQDYEASFFFGLINRHRYYATDPSSSVSKTEKFVYMYNFLTTAQDIYDWYMAGSTDTTSDIQLINNFRLAMIQ